MCYQEHRQSKMVVSTPSLINTRSLIEREDGTTKQLVAQENSRLGTKYTAREHVVLHNVLILSLVV